MFEDAANAPTERRRVRFAEMVVACRTPIMWHRLPDFHSNHIVIT